MTGQLIRVAISPLSSSTVSFRPAARPVAAPEAAAQVPDSIQLPATLPPAPGVLARLGRSLAEGVLNGVAGVGLFLLGPWRSERKLEEYQRGEALLGGDFSARVAESALGGLTELFRRPDLPGKTAAERLDFVLWTTDTDRGPAKPAWERLQLLCTHFRPDSPFVLQANDRGFAPDVADGVKWYNPEATGFVYDVYTDRVNMGSPQVGHFLTAVDIGRQPAWKEALLRPAAVGHELVGDDQGAWPQILAGLTHGRERRLFAEAIRAAEQGERARAHRLVEDALPDLSVSGNEPGRVGNSKQDLLNTAYGIAFGRMVRRGDFASPSQAADWLDRHLGAQTPSLPWNDPQ